MNDSYRGQSELITTTNDCRFRQIHELRLRTERDRTGHFVIDGLRPVTQALQLNAPIETVFIARPLLTTPAGLHVLRRVRDRGIPILSAGAELYRNLSRADQPQGIGAVVRQQWEPLHGLRPSRGLCWIAVDGVQFPGNLGTIIRTSEAVGGAGIILIGDSSDPYDPVTVRASMGALFNQRFVRTDSAAFTEWKRRRQCTLVGTSLTATQDYRDVIYPRPSILLMGSERRGITETMLALCDLRVRIPMIGRSDSLNVGVAAGVMLYELYYQRSAARRRPAEAATD